MTAEILPFPATAVPPESQALRDFRTTAEKLGITGFLKTPEQLAAMRHQAEQARAPEPQQPYRHVRGRIVNAMNVTMTDVQVAEVTAVLLDQLTIAADMRDGERFDEVLLRLTQLRHAERAAQTWRRAYGVTS